jgi:uncharacterized protein
MRIAIIGTGIAGNAAAYALATGSQHHITVYERDLRLGGHSATVDISYDGTPLSVDTGFIVYNESNYPNLTALFRTLGIRTEDSDMSFALSDDQGSGFEWCGRTKDVFNGLFAQRKNLLSPRYIKMLLEVLRFNKLAIADRRDGVLGTYTLNEYLAFRKFSHAFRDDYLVPMGAAIWSMSPASMLGFPAESFIAFFENHHLLQWNRPVWRTVSGGSRNYVRRMTSFYRDHIRTGAAVVSVKRLPDCVEVIDSLGHHDRYDHVIIASHSDEALAMLADPSADETAILGAIGFRNNEVYLHRDESFMPQSRRAWASWNVKRNPNPEADLCVTYWMNILQNLPLDKPVFVTLNPPVPPKDELVFGKFNYAHPQYSAAAIAAQKKLPLIQGRNRTHFIGAWNGYGFHEDGISAGLSAAEALGGRVPWRDGETAEWSEAAE